MSLFNKNQIKYEQKNNLIYHTEIRAFDFRITINKADKNNVEIQICRLFPSTATVLINISVLPEIFDLLDKIKVSYLNDKIYVNKTSKFFLTNFDTDYYQLPEVTIKGKRAFSYDERVNMFVNFVHNLEDGRGYKIDDLEKVISVRIAYLEQYLLETKHPSFIKRSREELLISPRINTSDTTSVANLAAAGGQYKIRPMYSTLNKTNVALIDAIIYEIMGLCNKYRNVSSSSKEVYRIKSTIKHVNDLMDLFHDLSGEEQASSSTKLIKILDDVLGNVKNIIKQIEESNVFEFDIQCKFIESIYNE